VSKTFTAGEWVVELELYAGGSGSETTAGAIGVAGMRGGMIEPHKDLRGALETKAKRYGALDAPYLISMSRSGNVWDNTADGELLLVARGGAHSSQNLSNWGEAKADVFDDICRRQNWACKRSP
jgi:hypothetical protein